MRVWWMSLLVLACAVPARAQASRGYVGGAAGAGFSDGGSAPALAAQGGVRITGQLFAVGEGGWLRDVLPAGTRDELEVIGRLRALGSGSTSAASGRLGARYAAGGARWMREGGRWIPFVEGTAGVAMLRLRVDGLSAADADAIANDVRGVNPDTAATKLIVSVGGGVSTAVHGAWMADAGYHYSRIATASAIQINTVYGALRYAF